MKAIIVNIIFLLVWVLVGHFFSPITLITTFIFYPALFIFSSYFIQYNISSFIVIPFCYFLILLNDYLFRIFGGGIHDDAGRGWCELIFYITLLTTTIAMFFVAFKIANNNKTIWLYNSLLVIGSALTSYLVFIKFSVKI